MKFLTRSSPYWFISCSVLLIGLSLAGCAPPAEPVAMRMADTAGAATTATAASALATIRSALVAVSPTALSTPDLTATAAVATTDQAAIMATLTAIAPTVAPAPTVDHAATETAQTNDLATKVAATLTAQPTPTANVAATQTADAQAMAAAIAATLTAQPTATPYWAATQTEQARQLERAIAATLTAQPTATPTAPPTVQVTQIGQSTLGAPIEVYRFGNGRRHIVLIGGLHAGFAPGTVTLAQRAIQYFQDNPGEIPSNISLHIIPNANPDSPFAPGAKAGRLNANGVDLNRNWDCNWQPNAVWRDNPVSGGSFPFSERETVALQEYLTHLSPVGVVFWEAKMENGWSAAGGCAGVSPASQTLAALYGNHAGYTVAPWEAYTVNGDATNWLDEHGIPAISVLILDYEAVDWANNLRAIRALLRAYSQ